MRLLDLTPSWMEEPFLLVGFLTAAGERRGARRPCSCRWGLLLSLSPASWLGSRRVEPFLGKARTASSSCRDRGSGAEERREGWRGGLRQRLSEMAGSTYSLIFERAQPSPGPAQFALCLYVQHHRMTTSFLRRPILKSMDQNVMCELHGLICCMFGQQKSMRLFTEP